MPASLNPLALLYGHLQRLVEGRLWAKVMLGLALGVVVGLALGPTGGLLEPEMGRTVASWLGLPGDMFIGLVQMIMIPLILSSIIQGIAGGGATADLAKLGPRVGLYFLAATLGAIGVGVACALIIEPGSGLGGQLAIEAAPSAISTAVAPPKGSFDPSSITKVLLPRNPLASMVSGEMLSIVAFALISALALRSLPKTSAAPILQLLGAVQEICMTITGWAMRLAPYAVFGLIARVVTQVGLGALGGIGMYMGTVLLALLGVALLFGVVLAVFTPMSPLRFLAASRDVLLLAFSVASSAAVMPLSIKTAEERLGVPPETSRFVIPVGVILNMSGTAAYQAVAALFLAQVYELHLGLPAIMLLVVSTVAASIGTPSAPGAGIIMLSTVLASVGIPTEGIALIIGVDHVLGMARTTVNVASDLVACVVFKPAAEALAVAGD